MNISNPSRDLALTMTLAPDEGAQQHRMAAAWARAPAFLRGRSGLIMLAAGLAATGLLAGWTWLGTAAVLPVLYALPCAAMMAMCMRGHGGSEGNASAKPGTAAGGSQSSLPQ